MKTRAKWVKSFSLILKGGGVQIDQRHYDCNNKAEIPCKKNLLAFQKKKINFNWSRWLFIYAEIEWQWFSQKMHFENVMLK